MSSYYNLRGEESATAKQQLLIGSARLVNTGIPGGKSMVYAIDQVLLPADVAAKFTRAAAAVPRGNASAAGPAKAPTNGSSRSSSSYLGITTSLIMLAVLTLLM